MHKINAYRYENIIHTHIYICIYMYLLIRVYIYIYIYIYISLHAYICLYAYMFIEYGREAKPSILGLQIVFLAAPRDDDGYYGDYRARQEL